MSTADVVNRKTGVAFGRKRDVRRKAKSDEGRFGFAAQKKKPCGVTFCRPTFVPLAKPGHAGKPGALQSRGF